MWKGSSRKTIKDMMKIAKRPLETRFEEHLINYTKSYSYTRLLIDLLN